MTKTAITALAIRNNLMRNDDANMVDQRRLVTLTRQIKATGQKLDDQIHAAAYACLMLARADNNGEPARQLVLAMPKAGRAKTLADWFEAHSNIRLALSKDGEWSVGMAKGKHQKDHAALADLMVIAWNKPFYTVAEQTKGPKAFSAADAFNSFMARIEKHSDDMPETDKAFFADIRKAGEQAGLLKTA